MQEDNSTRRAESRLVIDTRGATFLGSHPESGAIFEYVLTDLTPTGVGFSVPSDGIGKTDWICEGARLKFHLPFLLGGRYFSSGLVRWQKPTEPAGDRLCGACLDDPVPLYYPIFVSLDSGGIAFAGSGDDAIIHYIVKDAWLLKRGIEVYFKHLIPFFRRLRKGTESGQEEFIERFTHKLEKNIAVLDRLRHVVSEVGS